MARARFDVSALGAIKHKAAAPVEESQPVGRPRNGKRSNDAYKRLTVLVPDADVRRMKQLLLNEGEARNMSDFIAEALSEKLQRDGAK